MSNNDLIDIIVENPSGAPLAVNMYGLAQLVTSIERLALAAAKLDNGPAADVSMTLTSAAQGSIRFRFNLDITVSSTPNTSTASAKDGLTRTSEILSIVAFVLAVAAPTSAHAPPAPSPSAAAASAEALLKEPSATPLIESIRTAASNVGSEQVTIEIRETRSVIFGKGAIETPKVTGPRQAQRSLWGLRAAGSGSFRRTDRSRIEVIYKKKRLGLLIGDLTVESTTGTFVHRVGLITSAEPENFDANRPLRYTRVELPDLTISYADADTINGLDTIVAMVH